MKFSSFVVWASMTVLAGHARGGDGDGILGTWIMPDGAAKVEVYPCKERYCGKLVWLKEPNYGAQEGEEYAGKPKLDRHNPNPARRGDPVVGKEILTGLAQESARAWSGGEIYDTKSGTTYQCKATLNPEGKLELRGFVGVSLFGRTSTWTRQ